ncbi:Mur ligase family protein [Enterococcus gilvus]|uniref:Mur ligase family protein n=1 Tax=Enterococcus gilvus TaxID=160453 RepID=UPI00290A9E9B|nr:Mur ligase family protein [Enterococcus gilvus]MDU5511468.1 Mur ligase family protein [Enterococcus gilvus]
MKISDVLNLDSNNKLLYSNSVDLSINIDFFDHQINQFLKDKTDNTLGSFIYIPESRRTKIRMRAGANRSMVLSFLNDEKNSIAVLITEEPMDELYDTVPQIIVDNTWETYKKIATFQRNLFARPVVSFTGSVGKSTTRLLCCALYEASSKSVLTNDRYGSNIRTIIPRFLTQLDMQDVALLEVSINALTNFDGGPISPVIQSDVAVITQVGGAHLGDFKNTGDPIMELAKRKANIFKGMKKNGLAILNLDMQPKVLNYLEKEASSCDLNIQYFSLKNSKSDAYILEKKYFREYTEVIVSVGKEKTVIKLNMPTDGVLCDLLAALLVYKYLGNDIKDLYDALENFKSLDDELEIFEIEGENSKYTIVDDTHGSTIFSAINSISFFEHRGDFYNGKKILVTETCEDLGEHAHQLNSELLPHIVNSNIDIFIGYGDENIKNLVESLKKENFTAFWIPNLQSLFKVLENQPSDSVMFIKSRDGRKLKYKSDLWTFPKLLKKDHFKNNETKSNSTDQNNCWLSDLKKISEQKNIYISGSTYFSQRMFRVLRSQNINVSGFVLINNGNQRLLNKPIISYTALDPKNDHVILMIRGNKLIENELSKKNFSTGDFSYADGREMNYPITLNGASIGKWSTGDGAFSNCLGNRSKYNCIKSIGNFTTINGSSRMNVDHVQKISVNNKFLSYLDGDATGKEYIIWPEGMTIGADVWIGANTYINASKVTSIGNGAIIAAGAIVNENVPDFAVVGGVPSKVIKYRYSKEQIDILNKVRWWEWENEKIEENKNLILNPDLFFEKYK